MCFQGGGQPLNALIGKAFDGFKKVVNWSRKICRSDLLDIYNPKFISGFDINQLNPLPWRGFKKVDFTLAEVLITIGIIGVVAALTLPVLMQKIQQDIWINQLKKNYAVLNQGFKMMLADNNVSSLSDIPLLPQACLYTSTDEDCESFYDNMKKYFKISYAGKITSKYNYYLTSDFGDLASMQHIMPYKNNVIIFQDGSMLFRFQIDNSGGAFALDVNGVKPPNKPAEDIFSFFLMDDGRCILMGEGYNYKEKCLNKGVRIEDIYCGGALKENNWKRFW